MKILVLRGGPDRERDVSLLSGESVAAALRSAGHDVRESDIGPTDLTALDEFIRWEGDAVFPVLHGSWGEGGPLQRILDERGLPYVGCRAAAAELCMDKARTKQRLVERGIPTAEFQVVRPGEPISLQAPVVLKAPREGSSIDLVICKTQQQVEAARADLHTRHEDLLVERFVRGKELTVGVIGGEAGDTGHGGHRALPIIRIIPATEFYDYAAKYTREDTQYVLDESRMGVPRAALATLPGIALRTFAALGCRHLARVDFIVDEQDRPWVLEVNTIPGFTSHSLVPKAAAHAGIAMPALVDRLAMLAARG